MTYDIDMAMNGEVDEESEEEEETIDQRNDPTQQIVQTVATKAVDKTG
jgi:hypothetical protein